jgi:succinate-semialdehyde dehydrogenase / glutarate-semialdehyde dehydrogenase
MTATAARLPVALRDPSLLACRNLVDGRWIEAPSGKTIAVVNPFDGTEIARVPDLDRADVAAAIDAAHAAQAAWAARPAKERAVLLRRWYELIIDNADDLAAILTAEQGKPVAEAKAEIVSNAAYLEWFGEEAKRVYGDVIPAGRPDQRILVIKQPIGVCAAITPWNFPNGMITRKAGPALAAGCTILLKPASQTPLSALALGVLAERAGIPPGVFSVVTGAAKAIGAEFCHNPKIAKITFTGSTEVGRWLMREAADQVKKLSLELGGNAPFLVFADADLDAAVDGAMIAKFRNAGQTCVCANRFYVEETVREAFVAKLAERAAALTLGSGLDPATAQGPLIDEKAVAKVEEHVADALSKGARLVTGGKRSALGGTFFEPTVVDGVTQAMRVAKEETFGPLAPVISFTSEEEAIAMANDTEFGLASYVYTTNLGRAFRVAEKLQCGVVGVNSGLVVTEVAPFGGVKQSGLGREGSRYGIEGFLEIKYICLGGV